ncbi:MAG: 4-hydroxy-3-methylbut-2-enyl diphosphate reductase [Lachnospiraceae bacterium]|nr:4-hydroxy-3-methylbut-2-enyl diphosphate reductase [Lachnospiraceae bacterium]
MKVNIANTAGFCFGVKRAVNLVYEEAEKHAGSVYTMGPIIHNETVVDDLRKHGVRVIGDDLICEDTGKVPPEGSVVIVRSHGISREIYERVEAGGYQIVNATCPFVKKIHDIVAEKSREGCTILIIGNPEHPEVKGIRGWAEGECYAAETEADIRRIPFSAEKTVCVVAQTTFNFDKFQELVEIVSSMGYHVIVKNTICNATKERQTEAMDLARASDVMLVLGSRASSNTQKLYEICRSQCVNTYYIQKLDDLENEVTNFPSDSCVGITAGASTPNNIIQEVSQHVRGFCTDARGEL